MATAAKSGSGGFMMVAIGGALALILGAAGFYTVYSGLVALPPAPGPTAEEAAHEEAVKAFAEEAPKVAFVPLEPIVITLGGGDQRLRQLQLVAQLEVEPGAEEALKALEPRIRDVLNTYLRAVRAEDVDDPAALLRMRAQMLRRIQVVSGDAVVRDLLVSEFILR